MAETDQDQRSPDKAPPAPRRKRRLWWRVAVWLLLAPAVFAAAVAVGVINQEVSAPDWVKTRVEDLAGQSLGGGTIRVGAIHVTIDGTLHPHVRLTNVVLRDRNGVVLARLPEAVAQVSPRGLVFRREILPQVVEVRGLQINLRRAASGLLTLAFDTESAAVEEADNFVALLERFDDLFERPGLEALRRVEAEGMVVNYDDARAGRSWTVDGGSLHLALTGGLTRLSGNLSLLSGRSFVTELGLDYTSPRARREAEVSLTVRDGLAVDLASQSPALSWLAALDAPLSGAISAKLDENGSLGPVEASVRLGAGALKPTVDVRPVNFAGAQTDFTYDPARMELRFGRLGVQSEWGSFDGEAQAYLRDLVDGWPSAIEGQVRLNDISANPDGMFASPVPVTALSADFRLRPQPFSMEIGALDLDLGQARLSAHGRLSAEAGGWNVAVDGEVPSLDFETLLTYWPPEMAPKPRNWVVENILGGFATDLRGGIRAAPGQHPFVGLTWDFHSATVRFSKEMPPFAGGEGRAALAGNSISFYLDDAEIDTPAGDVARIGGTWMTVADTTQKPAAAQVHLVTRSTVAGTMSMLDLPPLTLARKSRLPVDLGEGTVEAVTDIAFLMKPRLQPGEITYSTTAVLTDVASEVLVKGHSLRAARLDLTASTEAGLAIRGEVRIGAVPFTGQLTRAAGPDPATPTMIEGRVELSQATLDEFRIPLPQGTVTGRGEADVALRLVRDAPPELAVDSDLAGVALASDALGWRLGAGQTGILHLQAHLGDAARIDRIVIDAGGLAAEGAISLAQGGALDVARFDRVRLGGWFDGPVELRGRGAGKTPAIVVSGGTMDLRRASFGNTAAARGQGGPVTLALDRVQVTEGIALRRLRGEFDTDGGFSGRFAADVNGEAPVQGTIVPVNGRSAVRISSETGGAVLSAAGLIEGASGGDMDLTLTPTGERGNYDGVLSIQRLRVQKAPALAALLDAISVIGLLQQLDGQGMAFDTVEALFRVTPDEISVSRSSAIGVGLGISMDGNYTLASGNMAFQGVVSPFYLLNGIGAVLTRPGEGLVGFNYTLSGPYAEPKVSVNPLSIFTPGMFRDIFRSPPPEPPQ